MPDRYRCAQCGEVVPAAHTEDDPGFGHTAGRYHVGGRGTDEGSTHYYCGPVLPEDD